MTIQESISVAKKLPIEDLLKFAIKNTETDFWIHLTLVISQSDGEMDIVLQSADTPVDKMDYTYGTLNLSLRDIMSDKWVIAEIETGKVV